MNFEINLIFLIKPFFLHDQKVMIKTWISWERKELLRWNKQHFSHIYMTFNEANNTFLFGRCECDFKLTILTFWTKFPPKRVLPVKKKKKKKSEHDRWISHIGISLGTKFHLKLTILTFWTKFAQKGHFWSKTKKVNGITELCIFKLN